MELNGIVVGPSVSVPEALVWSNWMSIPTLEEPVPMVPLTCRVVAFSTAALIAALAWALVRPTLLAPAACGAAVLAATEVPALAPPDPDFAEEEHAPSARTLGSR